ncbi:MAG: ABC transporter ATP-binding protein [Rhodobacterales bacterium]|nr:ABC transporter ATP-binding protein [Rhodobacterales bacterium]
MEGAGLAVAGRAILTGIDLHLTEARIGLAGRNGSGKTTLLRLMAGLVAPSAGRVRVDGIDPFRDRRGLVARLGVMFQNPDHQIIFPTCAEEIAFGLRQTGLTAAGARAAALRLLQQEGRAAWAEAPVAALSQGQRQYLCLLAVLAMQPATILLDEPFAALDLPTQARLARRLAALPQRLVVVSHDPAVLARCDRVVWIEGGRIADDGPPGVVLPAYLAAMEELGARDADADLPG